MCFPCHPSHGDTTHDDPSHDNLPPGGATALIAASALDPAPGAGYMFLVAIMISTLVMQAIALAVNNTLTTHTYPRYWWGDRGVWSGMGLCGKARRQGRV